MSVVTSGCSTAEVKEEKMQTGKRETGAPLSEGKFSNTEINYNNSFSKIWDISAKYMKAKRQEPQPKQQLPVSRINTSDLESEAGPVLYRLGHSSILIKLDGEFILTDPVFSDRASPVQWAGPKRFHKTPITIEELPPIKAVVISHDHYDHLDKDAVVKLANKVEWFVTPLAVGERIVEWGVDADKVIEKDWWQSVELGSITLTATPTQHFSGRGLFDKDKTLWASWVIKGVQANLYFSGDSGYFGGFKEIGERYGPFDITMIETGAYNELWSEIHMLPEQSVQAHIDLKGKAMLPIHNSTFDLALHDWFEPLEEVKRFSEQHKVKLLTPIVGQKVKAIEPQQTVAWWRGMMPVEDGSQPMLAAGATSN